LRGIEYRPFAIKKPVPVFFANNSDLVNALFAGVILTQIVMLLVAILLAGVFIRHIRIDQCLMVPAILFCV
jgi:TctA family transporter